MLIENQVEKGNTKGEGKQCLHIFMEFSEAFAFSGPDPFWYQEDCATSVVLVPGRDLAPREVLVRRAQHDQAARPAGTWREETHSGPAEAAVRPFPAS